MSAQDYMFALGRMSYYASLLVAQGDPFNSLEQVNMLADHFKKTNQMLMRRENAREVSRHLINPPAGVFAPTPAPTKQSALQPIDHFFNQPPPAAPAGFNVYNTTAAQTDAALSETDAEGTLEFGFVPAVQPVLETQPRPYTGNTRGRPPSKPAAPAGAFAISPTLMAPPPQQPRRN